METLNLDKISQNKKVLETSFSFLPNIYNYKLVLDYIGKDEIKMIYNKMDLFFEIYYNYLKNELKIYFIKNNKQNLDNYNSSILVQSILSYRNNIKFSSLMKIKDFKKYIIKISDLVQISCKDIIKGNYWPKENEKIFNYIDLINQYYTIIEKEFRFLLDKYNFVQIYRCMINESASIIHMFYKNGIFIKFLYGIIDEIFSFDFFIRNANSSDMNKIFIPNILIERNNVSFNKIKPQSNDILKPLLMIAKLMNESCSDILSGNTESFLKSYKGEIEIIDSFIY